MSDRTFENLSVIITGASSGIGRELSRQLAAQGARVILAARQAEKLGELADECKVLGGQALVVPADVTDPDQCRGLVDRTVEAFGRLDMLVNNAGTTMWARFDEVTDLSIFEKLMRVNYLGSVYCTYYALPHLKQSKGRIVGVSSLTF
jgi:NAD(P)-dependent dehydrogenase (short-subunit alcohol dehydrogenase family)